MIVEKIISFNNWPADFCISCLHFNTLQLNPLCITLMDPGRIGLPPSGCKPDALPLCYRPGQTYLTTKLLRCPSEQFCFCLAAPDLAKRDKNQIYFLLGKILNILVSHFSQVPVIARRCAPPFPLKEVSWASFIILLALHLTQYASV